LQLKSEHISKGNRTKQCYSITSLAQNGSLLKRTVHWY